MALQRNLTISAAFAASYTAAMYRAQQFEHCMKVILFLGDKYDLLPKLKLTKRERERFRDTATFLDEAGTAGRLLIALNEAGLVKNKSSLQDAVSIRNDLAHWFLASVDFKKLTNPEEKELIVRLDNAQTRLFNVVLAAREIQSNFEKEAALKHAGFKSWMQSLGLGWIVGSQANYVRQKKGNL